MKFKTGDLVNVNLSEESKSKLGLNKEIKNPCEVKSFYTNGIDGYYFRTGDGRKIAVAAKYENEMATA